MNPHRRRFALTIAAVLLVCLAPIAPAPAARSVNSLSRALIGAGVPADAARMMSRSAPATSLVPQSATAISDLDGDGVDEIAVVVCQCGTLGGQPFELEMRSGLTGSLLWSYESSASLAWVNALPAASPGGTSPGALLVTVTIQQQSAVTFLYDMTLAYLTATGTEQWRRTINGVITIGLNAFPEVRILDGAGGPETDVAVIRRVSNLAPVATVDIVEVLDGLTGRVEAIVAFPSADNPAASPTAFAAVADLSGDGRGDFVVATSGSEPRVSAHRASDGARIWTLAPEDEFASVVDAGDTSGDGRSDVLATGPKGGSTQSILLDGATGEVRWQRMGWPLPATATDGTDDVILQRTQIAGDTASVHYERVSGTGVTVMARSYSVTAGSGDPASWRTAFSRDAGDIDGDGIADSAHQIQAGFPFQHTVVSGATLDPIRSGRVVQPFSASLDGHGDDAVFASHQLAEFRIQARDGLTDAIMWVSTTPAAEGTRRSTVTPIRTATGAAHVLAMLTEDGGPDAGGIIVFRGSDGALLWSR